MWPDGLMGIGVSRGHSPHRLVDNEHGKQALVMVAESGEFQEDLLRKGSSNSIVCMMDVQTDY